MGSGKPGDHPLTDLLIHSIRTLPDDICDLILEIHRLDPDAFEYEDFIRMQGRPAFETRNSGDWFSWQRGENLDQARLFMAKKLEYARQVETIHDPAAEQLASNIRDEFPEWQKFEQREKRSFPLDYPDEIRSGKRIEFPVFVIRAENPNSFSCLSLYTYPDAEFYWQTNLIQRYPSGEIQYVLDFIHDLLDEKLVVKEIWSQYRLLGQAVLDIDWYQNWPIGELEIRNITWRRDC